jgi:hypothetical protein
MARLKITGGSPGTGKIPDIGFASRPGFMANFLQQEWVDPAILNYLVKI